MYRKGCLKKSWKGSITVEAAVIMPVFISVILTMVLAVKVIYIRNAMESAITAAATDMATYAYLYEVSGAKAKVDELNKNIATGAENFDTKRTKFLNTFSVLNGFAGSAGQNLEKIQGGETPDYEEMIASLEKVEEETQELQELLVESVENPKREFASVVAYFVKNHLESYKKKAWIVMAKYLTKRYIHENIFSSTTKPGAYVGVKKGGKSFDEIDFSESSFFENKDEIEIVIQYPIKLNLPFNILPDLKVKQRAVVKAWTKGDGGFDALKGLEEENKDKSIWAKDQLERGRALTKTVGEKYSKPNRLLEVRTIDLQKPSYRLESNALKSIQASVASFAKRDAKGKEKLLVIVVPEGTLINISQENMKTMEKKALDHHIQVVFSDEYGK